MLFPTREFLYFFCAVFAVYWALPWHRARMLWLLLASCYFYMSWNPWLIGLILLSASLDYVVALQLERVQSPRVRRALVIFSVSCNLGLLAWFKYANFFLASAHDAIGWFGVATDSVTLTVILPLGISFYTFETISYVVDVYRRRLRARRNLLDYALYIMFFPHLIAGPIVRAGDFLQQVGRRKRFSWDRCQLGAQLFAVGLFKKAVLADHLAAAADPVFKAPGSFGSAAVWLAVLSYAGQIYCDFSGYSDMAIGLAHLLGFKLQRNFDLPYLSENITEFWRRWHISLSTWLRDYLYIPLGGSRGGKVATYRNLMLTMLLGGLWHGANWTFVFWGVFHGGLLALHKALPLPRWLGARALAPVRVAGTFLLVSVGWVFFRAPTFAGAADVLGRLVRPARGPGLDGATTVLAVACLLVIAAAHLLLRAVNLRALERRLPAPVIGAAVAALLMATLILLPRARATFIYFQF
jgi:alginate O-acetyltransferase complex protein AlgI